MDVLELLRSKNRCLNKFLDISNEFLDEAATGDFSRLEEFENERMCALKAFDLLDRKVHQAISSLGNEKNSPEFSIALQKELSEKKRLVQTILSIDEKIILALEMEKSRISQEMASAQKSKAAVQKFKSTWIPESGEELDKKL